MGTTYYHTLIVFVCFLSVPLSNVRATTGENQIRPHKHSVDEWMNMDRSDMEAVLERSLSWRERTAFWILKKSYKKQSKKSKKDHSDQEGTDGMAVTAFVFGILSILFLGWGLVFGVLAIVLGALAISRIEKSGKDGKIMAYLGLGLGALSILLTILALILLIILFTGFLI